jgi:hypothetical protein
MTKKRKNITLPTLKLEFIKSIKNKANVTVNDVLLSAFTGAIKKFNEQKGGRREDVSSRCLMPFSLPRSSKEFSDPSTALRNYWVMCSIPLPLAPLTAIQRLEKCNVTTTEVKKSPTAFVQMYLQELLPHILPKFLQLKTAHDIFSRHTVVFSNVPGPANVIAMCDEPVIGMQVLFPNILPTCIVLSYAGNVFLNLNIDDDNIPGLENELPKYFIEELKELCVNYKIDTEHMFADISPGCYFGVSKNQ